MKRFLSISLPMMAALGAALLAEEPGTSLHLRHRDPDGAAMVSPEVSTVRLDGDRAPWSLPALRQEGAQSGRTTRKRGDAPAKSKATDGKKTTSPRRTGPLSFRWPTTGRRIVEAYGERNNPETGTVTINPGVNIGATLGSSVIAAEDGTVSLVSWLPSYGTIVIVEHRGGYRTVYGNLATATISRGAVVGVGDRIGTVGQTLGGSFLHFEVWKGQTRLNPMTVLKGRS